jgi:hypothetical protein
MSKLAMNTGFLALIFLALIKDGADALYATNVPTEIDEDVRQEYWNQIRKIAAKSN